MKRKYPGNRRTSVPADRHKRAVAYRHIRYAVSRDEDHKLSEEKNEKKSFFITADQDDASVNNETEEDRSETLSIPKIEPSEPVETPVAEKKPEHPKKNPDKPVRKEKPPVRTSRRQRRKQAADEMMEELLNEPVITARNILTDPAGCMARVEKVDHPTLSMGVCVFWMLLKWIVIGFFIASFFGKFINQNPFGFARLDFRDIAIFAAKLGGFGFVAEIINYQITGMICSTLKKPVSRKKLISIDTYGIPSSVILLVIAFLLMEINTAVGTILFIAVCVLMLFLKDYALGKAGVSTRRHMLSVFICTVLFLVCGYIFIRVSCTNIWKILEDIMNI